MEVDLQFIINTLAAIGTHLSAADKEGLPDRITDRNYRCGAALGQQEEGAQARANEHE